jgi:8-hydroxy-5-deazaflavin:NADPH oxidoreductase
MLDGGLFRVYTDFMRLAIVGPGRIGGNAARLWSRAGHDVQICFSRHPDQLAARAAELGHHVAAASPALAAEHADVVMLAVPWGAIDQALEEVGPLAGKVVLDATNQFGSGPKPADGQTVAEFNSARMPGARYVRGFNTLTSGFQAEASSRADKRAVLFICGDYPAAKDIVAKLIEDAGFAAVDLGPSANAGAMEAPRRPGSVYGEEYRLPEARAAAEAVLQGREIPPTPHY